MEPARSEHVLLTVLGIRAQEAEYSLDGSTFRARLAPVALYELLPAEEKPSLVLALCTGEAAEQTWPVLHSELAHRVRLDMIRVPEGSTQSDVETFLRVILDGVSRFPEANLTVDVTHGFRHFSFLMYIAALYLSALKMVRVKRAVYGLLQAGGGPSPFLDLAPLLEFPLWVHAIQVLAETGSALPIAELLRTRCPDDTGARDVTEVLKEVSHAYTSGLPLELGFAVRDLESRAKTMERLLEQGCRLPLASELVDRLLKPLGPLACTPGPDRDVPKKGVELNEAELRRQARLVDHLLARQNLPAALGLMHEWTISWAIWKRGKLKRIRQWLKYKDVRYATHKFLEKCSDPLKTSPEQLSPEMAGLARFWDNLTELRNIYHHHGMREPSLTHQDPITQQKLDEVLKFWEKLRLLPEMPLNPRRGFQAPLMQQGLLSDVRQPRRGTKSTDR